MDGREHLVASELYGLKTSSVRMFDDDGEFLLVECAHVLPMWVEPNVAEGRTFIRHGAVHVVYEPRTKRGRRNERMKKKK